MRKLSQGRWRDAAFPASTIVIGAAVSLSLLGFWQVRFGEPLRIHGDHIYLLTFIKNSILGGSMWSIDLLGYPLIQNSVYYPSFDFSYKLILRFLSLFSSNVFVVLYWFYILSIVFVFLFGFISMRKLRFTNDVALIGALCFAITPFLALRATIHDFLALSYSVPLGVTSAFCAYQVRSLRDAGGFLSSWFTVLSIVIIGTSGLYYAFFSAAMIVLLGMVGTINHYRLGPITAALVAVFAIASVLVLSGYGPKALDVILGRVPHVTRFAEEQFNFGLQLAEALHVYADLGLFKRAFATYVESMAHLPGANGLFEWPGVIFTSIILVSPVAIFCAPPASRLAKAGLPRTLIFFAFCFIVAGLLFSMRGGIAYLFNVVVSPYIRATGRILPALTFLAILIFCAALQAVTHSYAPRLKIITRGALGLLAVASLYPSFGQFAWPRAAEGSWYYQQGGFYGAPGEKAMLASIRLALDAIHQARLSTVLQLPYLNWPEAAAAENFDPYQHELFFVVEGPEWRTKWSFGAPYIDPQYEINKAVLQPDKPSGLIDRARRLQFDAVLIEKRGYSSEELTRVLDAIRRESPCVIYDDPIRIVLAINRENCLPSH